MKVDVLVVMVVMVDRRYNPMVLVYTNLLDKK
jgi:hypothetical protein